MEALLLVVTFLGVAFVGVLPGIAVAIGLSLLAFVQRAWDPYRTELASLADVPGFHDLDRHPEGRRVEGLVIARFDAPLFFANGEVFAEHIRSLVDGAPWPVKWVLVAAEPITGLDTTALDELVQLDDELAQDGISLVFAEMKGPIKDRLIRFGASARFTADHFFPLSTTPSALTGKRQEWIRSTHNNCPLDGIQGQIGSLPMPAVAGAGAVVAKQQQVPGRDPERAARASGVHNIGLGEEAPIDPDAAGGLDHHLLPGQAQDPLNDRFGPAPGN